MHLLSIAALIYVGFAQSSADNSTSGVDSGIIVPAACTSLLVSKGLAVGAACNIDQSILNLQVDGLLSYLSTRVGDICNDMCSAALKEFGGALATDTACSTEPNFFLGQSVGDTWKLFEYIYPGFCVKATSGDYCATSELALLAGEFKGVPSSELLTKAISLTAKESLVCTQCVKDQIETITTGNSQLPVALTTITTAITELCKDKLTTANQNSALAAVVTLLSFAVPFLML